MNKYENEMNDSDKYLTQQNQSNSDPFFHLFKRSIESPNS